MISSIYTRIAIDVASTKLRHVRLDDNGQYVAEMRSGLNNCLSFEANLDQAPRAFLQDIVSVLFTQGTAPVVPVDTSYNPEVSGAFDIQTMRVGEVVEWRPRHVTVDLYNIDKGIRQNITVPKRTTAIIPNPLYNVMNEPNSTLQRLLRKLNLLDAVDEASASGKLDLIIQLPYVIKTEARREQAKQRRKDLEEQLSGSKYGIAYADGSEKITQLNRAAENNLMSQVEYLTEMLYGQLGTTKSVMDGTADVDAMLNYYNRTCEPILANITEEYTRKFLTKTARTQGQAVTFFRDPFKMIPIGQLAEIADKFTRNEIVSSNEFRSVIGMKPSKDPKADELRNSNVPQPTDAIVDPAPVDEEYSEDGTLAQMEAELDVILADLEDATNALR